MFNFGRTGSIFGMVLSLTLLLSPSGWAQEKASNSSFNEKQQVLAIYEATKTAKSANDYTELISLCDRALAREMTSKNENYVNSLKGWALNRRGVLRFETALELSDIGSSQGEVAMKKAMSDFDVAVELDPKRWRTWKSRGIALASQSRFAEAANDFTKVIDLKPDDVDAWFNRAEAHYHCGDFESAIADYDSVLAMSRDDVEALTGRGHAFYSLGRFSDALGDYQNVAAQLPKRFEAWINVGDAQQKLRRWEAVENAYAKAMELAPSAIAMQRMAWFKSTCAEATYRDPSGAKDLIEQAIALAGESTTNLDTLAAVQAANGEFSTAKRTQEKVIQLVKAQGETDANPGDVESFRTRLALYEEGESFRQDREPEASDPQKK